MYNAGKPDEGNLSTSKAVIEALEAEIAIVKRIEKENPGTIWEYMSVNNERDEDYPWTQRITLTRFSGEVVDDFHSFNEKRREDHENQRRKFLSDLGLTSPDPEETIGVPYPKAEGSI